ncbi:hypothetical protein E0F15_19335 [Frankia sp. B2]|uniref:hypothetical protein n=1 Tax=Frankia sp. B2 TaxID=2541730 RepID=UPI00106DCC27|nr:hypothetical protein [Frankia sp. B2]TFE25722.1 hypothetical protein E0F15_19335 [Frankia sp. B2]
MAPAAQEYRRYDVYDDYGDYGDYDSRARDAYDSRARDAYDSRAEPPPAPRESLLPYITFVLVVAVLAGIAGYTLNRLVGPAHGARSAHPSAPGATPSPTAVPTPSAVGGGLAGLTAEQVAIRLAGAGLPLHTTVVYSAATDPDRLLGRTNGYTSRIAFSDPRVGVNEVSGSPAGAIERGGAIEVFADAASAQQRATKLLTVTADNPLVTEYVFVQRTVVLRVSLVLTADIAREYEAALLRLAA